MTIVLAIPIPPTSNATAPRPRNSPVSASSASARAASASDGRLTSTSSGCSGLAADGARVVHARDDRRVGPQVDGARRPLGAELALRGVVAHQRRAVELGSELRSGRMIPTTVHQPPAM